MKVRYIAIVIGVFLFGLSGCAVTDFDPAADFREYKTFTWGESEVDVSNPVYDSDLINKRVRRTVEEEFAKRGIIKNDRNADFVVRYKTYTEEKERTQGGYPYGYRYLPFAYYPFGWWGYPYPYVHPERTTEYTEGTLILDIIDRQSDELVWRGSVSGDVENIANLRKQIAKGVKAIMKKYPVTPDAPLRIGGGENTIS